MLILFALFGIIMAILAWRSIGIHPEDKIADISNGWIYRERGTEYVVDLGKSADLPQQRTVLLEKIVDEEILRTNSIVFYTINTNVEMFIRGKRIYKHSGDLDSPYWDGAWKWHTIQISGDIEEGEVLQLKLCRKYRHDYKNPPAIYSAEVSDFFDHVLKKSFFSLVTGSLLLVLSITLLSLWILRRGWKKRNWDLANIALFTFFGSIAFLLRIPWVTWVFNDEGLLSTISTYSALLTMLPILNMSGRLRGSEHQHIYQFLLMMAQGYIIFRMIMEMRGHSSMFVDSPVEIFFVTLVSVAYFCVLVEDHATGKDEAISRYIMPMFGLYAAIFLDLLTVRFGASYYSNNFIGSIMLGGVFYIAYGSANSLSGVYKDSLDAQKYQILSETDALTQMRNRNSYTKYIESIDSLEGLAVIIMDVNNLKVINDSYGHQEGDRMLTEVAERIKKVFSDGYDIFRIGGDEFAILSIGKTQLEIEEDMWRFDRDIRHLNEGRRYRFSVAVGLAIYEAFRNETIDDLVNRADQNMYFKKITIKL